MAQSLQGKTALVTGSSRGIGKGIALRLAADGAFVIVHYGRNAKAAEEVVQTISQQGGRAVAVGANLHSMAGIQQLVNTTREIVQTERRENRLDILVNNAGIGTSSAMEETSEAEFDELFAVNVKAPFFIVQQLLPIFPEGGRIIHISSGVTRIAFPHIMAYNLTKGAINTFTLHLAQMLGPRGITVNTILPGIVDTDVNAAWLHTEEGRQMAAGHSALGMIGQPADIADVAAFLASEDSRAITGQLIDATWGAHL